MPISELGWIYTMGEKNSPPPGPRLVRQKRKSYMYLDQELFQDSLLVIIMYIHMYLCT